MIAENTLRLGLIGDNIALSQAPRLHRLAGEQNGIAVTYERLVPKDLGQPFERVFDLCRTGGYRGINVTYPYKERVTGHIWIDDPLVRAMGACNTVLFGPDGPRGFNTDYSGFVAAYGSVRGKSATGTVLMIGAGGVGRAVAFGLARLGCTELRLVDRDRARAEALAEALHAAVPDMDISIWSDAETAAQGATGLINCTPVGMVGHEGTPLRTEAIAGADWVFDAVYTPTDTRFLTDAAAAGLSILSGWELFFFQGLHAWSLFSGLGLDEAALRARLLEDSGAA